MILEFISNYIINKINSLPGDYQLIAVILIYVGFILFYSLFIFKFYRILANKNIIPLNLSQYNHSEHPVLKKVLAVILYLIEYIVILPFLVLFWFVIFSVFLLILSGNHDTQSILLIAAVMIMATRIASYINHELAKDMARIIPFGLLTIFILEANFFDFQGIFDKLIKIPSFSRQIFFFIMVILIVELLSRVLLSAELFLKIFGLVEKEEVKKKPIPSRKTIQS